MPAELSIGALLTRYSIWLSLGWYAAAMIAVAALQGRTWQAESRRVRIARNFWSLAFLFYLAHVACAFHFYHHWSHASAFARTREVSGLGEGIYVSYFFTLAWLADVVWWWSRPVAYAARPSWIDATLHAFMLFIVFNGTIVFEHGPIRIAAMVMFAAMAVAWFASRRRTVSPQTNPAS